MKRLILFALVFAGTMPLLGSSCSRGVDSDDGDFVAQMFLDYFWEEREGTAPEALRSLTAEERILPLGTIVYLKDWDGVSIPSVDGIGGFTHDGCVRVDDTGSGITGGHIEIFTGTEAMAEALEVIFDRGDVFSVYSNNEKCDYLAL